MPDRVVAEDAGWIRFQHPLAFWLGAAACTAGSPVKRQATPDPLTALVSSLLHPCVTGPS
jgi:hypothetical protein